MPTISSNDTVLVSGANGYIGLWIVKTLLERGYSVRAAIRAESKGRHMKELFKSYGHKLELSIVPDMTKEGAWDEAVNGVQAIAHVATPADFAISHPDEMIQPSIKGVVGLLESARKQSSVKRIVLTSSVAAVLSFTDPLRTYTEEDFNETSVRLVQEKGMEAGIMEVYSVSKVLAEKAAWDFVKKHRSEISWDLTVIAPPMVFGGTLGEATSPENINLSVKLFWDHVVSGTKTREELGAPSLWVDVRDLAEAHVLSLEKEKAGGERIFVNAGPFVWQDLVDVANKLNLSSPKVPTGFPDLGRKSDLNLSSTKAVDLLGLKYRPIEDTVKHSLEDFAKRGF